MKKKVLTCAVLLLSLGLLTGCFGTTSSSGDGDGEEQYDYVFGFLKGGSTLYAVTGKTNANGGLAYTTDMADAYIPYEYSEDLENNFTLGFYDHEDSETEEAIVKYLSVTTDEDGVAALSYTDEPGLIYTHDYYDGEIQFFGDEAGEYFIGYDEESDCVTLLSVKEWLETAPVCGMYNIDLGKFDRGGKGGNIFSDEGEEPDPLPSEDTIESSDAL